MENNFIIECGKLSHFRFGKS